MAEVHAAFSRILPAEVSSELKLELLSKLFDKIFNQAAAEFCVQVASIWGSGGCKEGVGIKQELKTLQKTQAGEVQKQNPLRFEPEVVLALDPEARHLHLSFLCKFHPELIGKKGVGVKELKAILKVYKVTPKGNKAALAQALVSAVLGAGGRGVGVGERLVAPPKGAGSVAGAPGQVQTERGKHKCARQLMHAA